MVNGTAREPENSGFVFGGCSVIPWKLSLSFASFGGQIPRPLYLSVVVSKAIINFVQTLIQVKDGVIADNGKCM